MLRKLNRKKYRQKEQLFFIEGERAVLQVLNNAVVKVESLFFNEKSELWNQNAWLRFSNHYDSYSIPSSHFVEVADTENPQGILALCRMPAESPADRLISNTGLVVALNGLQDPGNVGTIIRTASWFGVSGILSGRGTVDLFHPKVVRSTAGATGSVPFLNGRLNDILLRFEQKDWPVFLLDAGTDSIPFTDIRLYQKAVIVVGNEARGLQPEMVTENRQKVRISSPQKSRNVESLNAAVATSIAVYDLSGKLTLD